MKLYINTLIELKMMIYITQAIINSGADLALLNDSTIGVYRINNSMKHTLGPVPTFSGILIGHQSIISYTPSCTGMDNIFGDVSGTIKNVSF